MKIIQLYSPEIYHDDQAIVMNEEGRKQLLEALKDGKSKDILSFVNDGEGFTLHLLVLSDEEINKYKRPYTDKEFCPEYEGATKDPTE
jgi:hypothetical protein